jgi:hypothetical protein
MARDRNTSTETDETQSVETDPQAAEMQRQAPLMGTPLDTEGTTTDPMIKNKPI